MMRNLGGSNCTECKMPCDQCSGCSTTDCAKCSTNPGMINGVMRSCSEGITLYINKYELSTTVSLLHESSKI